MALALTFRERLMQEFSARCSVNGRYSLRAFAVALDVDHASLSQIMRGKRRVPVGRIVAWARKMKLSREESSVYVALAQIGDEQVRGSDEALRQCAAEILALLTQPVHREMLRLTRMRGFQCDCRWVAAQVGAGVDEVNIALSRLLRLGLLKTAAGGIWQDNTGIAEITPQSFRQYVADLFPNPPAKEQ